jgi:hypothetical protein
MLAGVLMRYVLVTCVTMAGTEKICTRNSMYWHYTGPNSIIVGGEVVKSGEYTEEFEMDWS